MKRSQMTRVALIGMSGALLLLAAGVEARQRGWIAMTKSSTEISGSRVLSSRPQAAIAGGANGIYCSPQTENGVRVHDLGFLPVGLAVTVTVESYSEGFDPAAAVIVATVGSKAANNVKTTTFYDNDSGGNKDSRIQFVTPQAGNYLLLVNDFTDAVAGCYRYQVTVVS